MPKSNNCIRPRYKNKEDKMKKQKRLPQPPPPVENIKPSPIITDPQGCYTGRPVEKYETPVQDADDL